MWHATGRARRPLASTSAATASQAFSLRLVTTTSAPASAKASTMERPSPRLPPVTRATLPASGPAGGASVTTRTPSSKKRRHGVGDGLAHRDVEGLVWPVGVGARPEDTGRHELGAREPALQVGQEGDGPAFADEAGLAPEALPRYR